MKVNHTTNQTSNGVSKEPLVSVIIPTKNRPKMVIRAIKSVQAQTYKNLEIIVVNDASTDDTLTILENLKKTDSRIIVFHNTESLGGAGARNVGLKNAHGDYIAFLDDDDEWLPNKTEAELKFLHENPDIKAVSCWYLFKYNDKIQQIQKPTNITFQDLLWENFLGSFSYCCIAREIFDKIGLLDESLPSAQDWDFWLRLTKEFNAGVIEQYLALYNCHNQARISSSFADKLRGYEIIFNKYSRYMDHRCRRHHQKFIYYYKSLSGKKGKERAKNLIKLLCCISNKQDIIFLLKSLSHFILPNKLMEKLKTGYRNKKMNKEAQILDPEEYKRRHGA